MKMTSRFADAFAFANELHCDQTRKGNAIPYVSHLMAVSAMVLEYGGDEDQAIAALLHDAVEDQGGPPIAKLIRERFGGRVANIVDECTDAAPEPGQPKAPWRARKQAYIDHLDRVSKDAALVVVSDKIHNLTTIIADVERGGPATLNRFNEPGGISWYYRSVSEALNRTAPAEPAARLAALVDRFEALAG